MGISSRNARTRSAASKSPLGSPATIMNRFGTILFGDLARDFPGEVQRFLGGLAAHEWRLAFAHALNEMRQLQFQRLLFVDGHRLAHDAFAGELTHDGCGSCMQQFLQETALCFAIARNPVDEPFLRAVIERDVAGRRAATEYAN